VDKHPWIKSSTKIKSTAKRIVVPSCGHSFPLIEIFRLATHNSNENEFDLIRKQDKYLTSSQRTVHSDMTSSPPPCTIMHPPVSLLTSPRKVTPSSRTPLLRTTTLPVINTCTSPEVDLREENGFDEDKGAARRVTGRVSSRSAKSSHAGILIVSPSEQELI
jgi:hypothetical protein